MESKTHENKYSSCCVLLVFFMFFVFQIAFEAASKFVFFPGLVGQEHKYYETGDCPDKTSLKIGTITDPVFFSQFAPGNVNN